MLRHHRTISWACCFAILAGGGGIASALRRPAKFAPPAGLCLAATSGFAGTAGAAIPTLPKLRIRAANRHLIEDENGKPFFMAGVCPQSIVHWCTPEQMDVYFADREKRHFNFAWVVVNAFDSQGRDCLTNPTDARGHAMLLHGASWDPENLNPAYVASVDAMVKSAAEHGIYLFLDPFSSGYNPGPAGFDPSQHSPEEMRRWGEFWGNRYQHYSHVNFALGNDRLVWPQVDQVVDGLEKYMPDRLVTTDWENGPPGWTSDGTGPHRFYNAGHHWVNLDAWYEYHAPQWATWYHYHMANPVMPTCIFETLYEGLAAGSPQHIRTPPQMMRGQVWGTVLNGGSGFGILGSPDCTEDPLRWLGKTPGVNSAEYATSFFTARRWYELVPDWTHTFLTSQAGTPGKNDYTYVSAAVTADGSFGVCYYPGESGPRFTLTVNMAKLGGGAGQSRARWYDPTSGAYQSIGSVANSGAHIFTTPPANSAGAADWVLVLEAASR